MNNTYLLYDRDRVELTVPESWTILEPADPPGLTGLESAIQSALENPIGSLPLGKIARSADKSKPAVVVVSDISRAIPYKLFLPSILRTLIEGGYRRDQITILIATGMHRPSTPEERIEILGPQVAGEYRVVDHRADVPETLEDLARPTRSGTRVRINKEYAGAGLRILTGFIEPHFMAGFSGGRKSICPGLVDLGTLQKFHGYTFLSDLHARVGNLEANPCHQESLDVAQIVRPDFIFNVTVNAEGSITGIFAGDLEQAHEAGIAFVRKTMVVRVDQPFDVVFTCGGGYPLDTTFYQTVKGMVLAAEYVRPGGSIVVASGCQHGIGSKAYCDLMFRYRDYREFLTTIAGSDRTELDQWEFQMHARVLAKTGLDGLIMACDRLDREILQKCHVTSACDKVGPGTAADQMKKLVREFAGDGRRIAIIPRGPYILPEVNSL